MSFVLGKAPLPLQLNLWVSIVHKTFFVGEGAGYCRIGLDWTSKIDRWFSVNAVYRTQAMTIVGAVLRGFASLRRQLAASGAAKTPRVNIETRRDASRTKVAVQGTMVDHDEGGFGVSGRGCVSQQPRSIISSVLEFGEGPDSQSSRVDTRFFFIGRNAEIVESLPWCRQRRLINQSDWCCSGLTVLLEL